MKASLQNGLWLALIAAAAAAALALVIFIATDHLLAREQDAFLKTARRVNQDVVVLAYSSPFPDVDRARELTAKTQHVERAGIFAITPVQLAANAGRQPGLLKLHAFDRRVVQHLGLSNSRVPRPRVEGAPPELLVGQILARRLQVAAGDTVFVHVAAGTGTPVETTVRCRIAAVIDWGYEPHSSQLVNVDLSHLRDFSLTPTGVELLVDPPERRKTVAARLKTRLGPKLAVMALEELVLSESSAAP